MGESETWRRTGSLPEDLSYVLDDPDDSHDHSLQWYRLLATSFLISSLALLLLSSMVHVSRHKLPDRRVGFVLDLFKHSVEPGLPRSLAWMIVFDLRSGFTIVGVSNNAIH